MCILTAVFKKGYFDGGRKNVYVLKIFFFFKWWK